MLTRKLTNLQRKFLLVTIACLAAIVFTPLTSLAQPPAPKPCFDFTGTGRTSFATISANQPAGSMNWNILSNGGDNSVQTYAFGFSSIEFGDGFAPGYYDGDNRADAAVTRLSGFGNGDLTFYIRPSTQIVGNPSAFYGVRWGTFPDLPRIGDYDGDGRTDLTVVRRDAGTLVWFILRSQTNTFNAIRFGLDSDLAVPGADYNGDGRDEVTVIRTYPNPQVRSSTYFAGDSNTGDLVLAQDWGSNSDVYVIGDYLGDRRADFAVMRRRDSSTPLVNAIWYILENGGSASFVARQFGYGESGGIPDIPVCGDYNGDGKQDIAVYRRSNRAFYWLNSPDYNSFSSQEWGQPNMINSPIGSLYTRSR